MTPSTIDSAIAAINAADTADLAKLRTAITQRETAIQSAAIAALDDGDRVRIVGSISPRYLLGLTGTYRGRTSKQRLRVEIDDTVLSYDNRIHKYLREGKYLDVPAGCLVPSP